VRRLGSGFFDDFVMQFDHRFAEHVQHGRPTGGQVVVTASPLPLSHGDFGSQPSVALQSLKEWIEGAWADVVAVTTQLGEDPLTDDRMRGGVMENVYLPEAKQDLSCEQLCVKSGHRTSPPERYYEDRKRM
jgi:hypothetical protein